MKAPGSMRLLISSFLVVSTTTTVQAGRHWKDSPTEEGHDATHPAAPPRKQLENIVKNLGDKYPPSKKLTDDERASRDELREKLVALAMPMLHGELYDDREYAESVLPKGGGIAIRALLDAQQSLDPELRRRIPEVLKKDFEPDMSDEEAVKILMNTLQRSGDKLRDVGFAMAVKTETKEWAKVIEAMNSKDPVNEFDKAFHLFAVNTLRATSLGHGVYEWKGFKFTAVNPSGRKVALTPVNNEIRIDPSQALLAADDVSPEKPLYVLPNGKFVTRILSNTAYPLMLDLDDASLATHNPKHKLPIWDGRTEPDLTPLIKEVFNDEIATRLLKVNDRLFPRKSRSILRDY